MRVNRGRERERRRQTYRCPSLPVCFFELHHDDLQSMPSCVVWVKPGGLNAVERGGSLAGERELRTAGRESEGLCSGSSGRRAARARAYARAHANAPPRLYKASSSLPRPHKADLGMAMTRKTASNAVACMRRS